MIDINPTIGPKLTIANVNNDETITKKENTIHPEYLSLSIRLLMKLPIDFW